jgi:enoyl-CoA hydratase/carnithine racemase
MKDQYETLKLDKADDHLLVVTLNRPHAGNSTNTQMGLDFLDLWTSLYIDQEDIRCIVLTGAGDRVFAAGGDLKERDAMTAAQWRKQHNLFERARLSLMQCPIPIVAAVNGAARGGGVETALSCDFIFAAERATFALTEVRLGIMPGGMGTQNLPRAVGVRRAKQIVLSGEPFTAQEAHDWGMVNKVCANDQLIPEAMNIARTISGNAPLSVYQAKKALNAAVQMDLFNGFAFEIEAYNRLVDTEDRREGVRAFNEKRKAVFKAR